MEIELYLNNKKIDNYNAAWDSSRNVLVVNIIDSQSVQPAPASSTIEKNISLPSDIERFLSKDVQQQLSDYVDNLLNNRNTPTKEFASPASNILESIKTVGNNDIVKVWAKHKVLEATFQLPENQLPEWARNVKDIMNDLSIFTSILTAEEADAKIHNEKIKALVKLMIDEKSNAIKQKGCTKCKLNSITKKYIQLLSQIEF